jgi:hypothetical protein
VTVSMFCSCVIFVGTKHKLAALYKYSMSIASYCHNSKHARIEILCSQNCNHTFVVMHARTNVDDAKRCMFMIRIDCVSAPLESTQNINGRGCGGFEGVRHMSAQNAMLSTATCSPAPSLACSSASAKLLWPLPSVLLNACS